MIRLFWEDCIARMHKKLLNCWQATIFNLGNVRFKLFATHPHPIHTPSIAILACDSLGPDTEKVGDLNKRGKRFSCDVDGVRDQGDLRGGIRKYFSE